MLDGGACAIVFAAAHGAHSGRFPHGKPKSQRFRMGVVQQTLVKRSGLANVIIRERVRERQRGAGLICENHE